MNSWIATEGAGNFVVSSGPPNSAKEPVCPRDEYLQRMSIFICSVFVRGQITGGGGLIMRDIEP